MDLKVHSEKQDQAIFSNYPVTVCGTGIQWGKTVSGAAWLGKYFPIYPKDNYIVTAPNYKILAQATLPSFKQMFGGLGVYKKVDAVFELHSGGNVFFRTATEPDSIVGVTNVRGVWGDEAGKYSLYFWENIQARCARLEAPVCLTTSPYTVNWIYKELIKPTQRGKRKDVKLISAKSIENPYFSKKRYYAQKKTMDPRRFKALYDGQFTQMQGLVYDCFDDRYNLCDPFNFPNGTVFYGAIDWGFTHPFVITIRALLPSGLQIQVSEFYKTQMSIKDMKKEIGSRQQMFNVKMFFCDPSRPDLISEMNQAGLSCVGADNQILVGIDETYELIKSRRLLFMRNSSHYTMDEFETYHWPEPKDLKPDQDDKELSPVDANNHVMDTVRYLTMGMRYLTKMRLPNVPEFNNQRQNEMPDQIIKRVKTKPKVPKHDNW